MSRVHFHARRLYRRLAQMAGSRIFVNPDPDLRRSILIAGTARSGTTWLGDLIASQIACRLMFEPFNRNLVPEYREFQYFQYMQPQAVHPALRNFARQVLEGNIRNGWIDRQNERLFPTHRLIKEIRANLLLKWLHGQFPSVPILFLMRHPCAVVLSRLRLRWDTDRDIASFLAQPDLIADHLQDHMGLIRAAETDEEKHAIIWCVSNLVPLKQFQPGELKIVYYENLCTQPEVELQAIFHTLQHPYDGLQRNRFDQPSQTSKVSSAIVTGTDKVSHWENALTTSQIENILRIVHAFGLDRIYDGSPLPLQLEI